MESNLSLLVKKTLKIDPSKKFLDEEKYGQNLSDIFLKNKKKQEINKEEKEKLKYFNEINFSSIRLDINVLILFSIKKKLM